MDDSKIISDDDLMDISGGNHFSTESTKACTKCGLQKAAKTLVLGVCPECRTSYNGSSALSGGTLGGTASDAIVSGGSFGMRS